MKTTHGIGLGVMVLSLGAAAWLGCGGDDSSSTDGADAGADALATIDAAQGDSGATDTGAAETGGNGDAGLSCQTYCSLLGQHCTSAPGSFPPDPSAGPDAGGNQQYIDTQTCLNECAHIEVGKITDTNGDTLGCRQYHGGVLAAVNPAVHCRHAGPSGGAMCSGGDAGMDRCETFCKLALAVCSADAGVAAGDVPFASLGACLASCGSNSLTYDPTVAEYVSSGDTLNCRQYHLEAAYSNAPTSSAIHCPHIGVPSKASGGGTGPCK